MRAALWWCVMSVSAALAAGCGPREDSPASGPAPGTSAQITASVDMVQTVEFPVVVEVTGQVTAVSQAVLSSKVQGLVREVRVREGSAVRKDDSVLVLDSRDLEAELARAEAELENAQAHLARMTRLYEQESVAKQELDNATRAFKVAAATKRAAAAQLSYTLVKAPFDGVITEKKVEAGELAAPGQPMLKIEDPARMRLEVTVAEGDLKAIKIGDTVEVLIDALGEQPIKGAVALIVPAGDPATHTFLAKVDLPPVAGLRSGMFGRLRFVKAHSPTLIVAKSSVIERGQLMGVFVVGQDHVARIRWIKLGRTKGSHVEVLSGLTAGERILANASQGVEGVRVESIAAVAPQSAPPAQVTP